MKLPKLPRSKRSLLQGGIFLLLMAAFAGFLFWFNSQVTITPLINTEGISFEKARVTEVLQDNLQPDGSRLGGQKVLLELLSGDQKGKILEAASLDGYLYGATCQTGTRVIAQVSVSGGDTSVSVYNYDRSTAIYLLAGLLVLVMFLIGGWRGLKSAFSLVFTLVCVLFLYIPMMYIGVSPFLAAVIVVVLTTVATMYLIGGWSVKTLCSILGTVAGVIVAGVIAWLFGSIGHLSGYNVSDIETLVTIGRNSRLEIGGLMFSGILIAALGAVMDVSISVASTVNEIYDQNPSLTSRKLFTSGIHVGRDMMGTMSNTLILAFTGSSVTLMVSLYAYQYSYNQILNMYSIGIELLQGLSGTLGVVLTVPFVSAIASWLLPKAYKKDAVKNAITVQE